MGVAYMRLSFSSLLDIDKITLPQCMLVPNISFSSLLDIDKITLSLAQLFLESVLVLCWILIKLHAHCLNNSLRLF